MEIAAADEARPRPILLHSAGSPGSLPTAWHRQRHCAPGPAQARRGAGPAAAGPSPPPGRQLQAPAERSLVVAGFLHHVGIILLPQAAHGATAASPAAADRPGPAPSGRRHLPAAQPSPAPPRRGMAPPPPGLGPERGTPQRGAGRRALSLFSRELQVLGSRFKHFFPELPSQS